MTKQQREIQGTFDDRVRHDSLTDKYTYSQELNRNEKANGRSGGRWGMGGGEVIEENGKSGEVGSWKAFAASWASESPPRTSQ